MPWSAWGQRGCRMNGLNGHSTFPCCIFFLLQISHFIASPMIFRRD
jgi:hypothetical protein